MAGLSIYLLGPLRVTLDGQPVTSFGYDKVRALLAYLAVESQRPHRRETLAGILWPDQSEKAAHDSLRNALSRLRHAIGDQEAQPPYLIINHDEIQFNPQSDAWLDIERFNQLLEECRTHRHRRIEVCPTCTDRLIEAANLYRGAFLEGFSLPDSDLFEDWLRIKRDELLQLVMESLQNLTSTYEWRGEPDKALIYTQRQLKLDPCSEESYTQAMKLLATLGMRSEACEQYEKCRQVLATELGVEPMEETTRLYEQIKYGVFQAAPSRRTQRINNLPTNLTSFVGRERELVEIDTLIEDPNCRLLTLVGPGGVGKTRLVITAANRQLEAFPSGACFVPLAGTNSFEGIVPSILQSLNLNPTGEGDLKKQLMDYLRDKDLVLMLDNFEHLLEGAAVVTEILQQAPGVMVLVTSRQRLGLLAEWVFEVNGLSYPTGKGKQDLVAYEAVMLFQQRLHQVKPRHSIIEDDLPSMTRICQLVEGLPLGIELAASAVRRRSIDQVANAIESGTEDLRVSYKDIPERHRSIRAVFDHSYRLLTENEQSAFSGLAVFRGGFTVETARQVAEATPEVLEALVEHSMVRYDSQQERYDLHELVRQYALDKLRAQGMESNLRQRHCRYFIQALERWEVEQEGAGQADALAEMDHELANLHLAWEWACQQQDLAGLSQALQGMGRYYLIRSRLVEGEHDYQAALDMLKGMTELNPQGQHLKALLLAYECLFFRSGTGWFDESNIRQTLEQCIRILKSLQQAGEEVRRDMIWMLYQLGLYIEGSDPMRAVQLTQYSLDLARQTGNHRYQGLSLWALGNIKHYQTEFHEAERFYQEALTELRTLGDTFHIALVLRDLSLLSINLGNVDVSLQAARESAQIYRSLGDRTFYEFGLSSLGLILWFGRQWEEADKAYEENIPHLQDMEDRYLLCDDCSRWSIIKMFLGQYETARVMAQSNMELENQLNDIFAKACNYYALGGVALAQGHVEQASPFLEKAATFIKQTGDLTNWAWAAGTWSLALIKLGQGRQAQELLLLALQTGVKLHSYPSLSFTLPTVALVLANTGQVERAVELCGLIDEHAMCGKTPWFEDVAGKTIKEMASSLTPEVVEAARERGKQRDLFSTAAELLEEFRDHP